MKKVELKKMIKEVLLNEAPNPQMYKYNRPGNDELHRMSSVVNLNALAAFKKAVIQMNKDLEGDGFDMTDAMNYYIYWMFRYMDLWSKSNPSEKDSLTKEK